MTQDEALTILKTGANVFLTGSPGSGKTHVINQFVSWLRAAGIEPSITAATGIAATHVGGMTLHAWSGIGVAEALSPADVDRIASKEHVARRIQKARVLIIEEVSMLSSTIFEMVDAVCREVRRDRRPFGGLPLVLVGDFFQLPPVSRTRTASFTFVSSLWKDLNFLICYLTEQHRQDDLDFLDTLSAIRSGAVGEMHRQRLSTRNLGTGDVPSGAPMLFSHNADVDRINTAELAKIPGTAKRFRMSSTGKDSFVEALKRGCLSPEILELKEGAAVMFTKNSPQGRFVNGTLGTVSGFDAGGMPLVRTKGGQTISVEPMEWQVEEEGKVRASISQVPLRLAYAMTVHKSQGMSMDAAVIDLSRAFEYGQGYVALSRVRRLSGLYLSGLNARALEVHPDILKKDRDFRAASDAARETFAAIPKEEQISMQKKFVKAVGGAWPSAAATRKASGSHGGLPARLAETLQTTRDSKNLKEAVRSRQLTSATLVKHLEELHEREALTAADFAHLVSPRTLEEVGNVFAKTGGEKLSPVFHALHARYDFDTIRLVRLLRAVSDQSVFRYQTAE